MPIFPPARLEQGLVTGLSLAEHFVLSRHRGLFIDRRRAADVAADRICAYNIKGSPSHPVESLSGGNQQRMLLALLKESLSLILLEHPTRGLDIESTLYIWGKLGSAARAARRSSSSPPTSTRCCSTATGSWSSSRGAFPLPSPRPG